MQNLYLATIFAGALICLLASLLLFSRRKDGERSRTILACIILFSVSNYITRFIALSNGEVPELVVSVRMLLLAIFMVTSYIMYPIEVISPGWLNFKRIVKLYLPLLALLGIYLITTWTGVKYTSYESLLEMLPHAGHFDVWFRLVLCLFIFMPVLFIFFIPYTRRYNNTDRVWIRKYVITLSINCLVYILMLAFDKSAIIRIIYYYVSVGCSLFIAYMELFVRLIGKSVATEKEEEEENEMAVETTEPSLLYDESVVKTRNEILIENLDAYMKRTCAWRNPDLSLNALAFALCTNRTTLTQAIQENGYVNYTVYINRLRINDFVHQIESNQSINIQEAFFDAGFRSRTTALRHFRQITGMTPSEYLIRINETKKPSKSTD
ncbi:MAG: AraC family transcriptional regulator [Bacteroidales bacterium]|nr:AraC family transcriptional regulator [Bacteroidales bacterium]